MSETDSFQRNLSLLRWLNFLSDFRLYTPVAIVYFSTVAGSFALGMSIFSMIMLAGAFFEVPTGILSDRVGRRWTACFGALASMGGVLCYALGSAYLILLVGAVLEGLARAFFSGNNDALLYDTLAESGQETTFQTWHGKVSAMYQMALGVSALIGGVLAGISLAATFWLTVIPQALCVVVTLRLVEPKVAKRHTTSPFAHLGEAIAAFRANPRLRAVSLASILGFALGETAHQFRPALYARLLPEWAIGAARTTAHAAAASSFYFAGGLIARFGAYRILITGIILNAVMTLTALLFQGTLSPFLISSTSIFFGVSMVATTGLKQREFTDAQRATMRSLNAFAGSIVMALAAFAAGVVADRIGVTATLIGIELLAIGIIALYRRAFVVGGEPRPPVIPS